MIQLDHMLEDYINLLNNIKQITEKPRQSLITWVIATMMVPIMQAFTKSSKKQNQWKYVKAVLT